MTFFSICVISFALDIQSVPEFMGPIVRVGKVSIEKYILHSNMKSKMRSVGGTTRSAKEKKKKLYLHNIILNAQMCYQQHLD